MIQFLLNLFENLSTEDLLKYMMIKSSSYPANTKERYVNTWGKSSGRKPWGYVRDFFSFKKDSRNPWVVKRFWLWQEKPPCTPPLTAGRKSVKSKEVFISLQKVRRNLAGIRMNWKQAAAEQTADSSLIAAASHLRFCRTLQARQTLYDAAVMTLFPCQREKAWGKKFLPVLLRLTQL